MFSFCLCKWSWRAYTDALKLHKKYPKVKFQSFKIYPNWYKIPWTCLEIVPLNGIGDSKNRKRIVSYSYKRTTEYPSQTFVHSSQQKPTLSSSKSSKQHLPNTRAMMLVIRPLSPSVWELVRIRQSSLTSLQPNTLFTHTDENQS